MSRAHRPVSARSILSLTGAAFAAVLAVAVLTGHSASALVEGALYLLPAVLFALVLLAGRYPGERVLRRLRSTRLAGPPERPANSFRPRQRPARALSGGRLIAVRLAGRGPPALAAC
jgi:hypothetical protein